jgi:thiol:disulfide interchange protein
MPQTRFRFATSILVALLAFLGLPAAAWANVTFSLVPSRTEVRPGEQIVIAAIFDHAEGWHVHTNDPKIPADWGDFLAIPTVLNVAFAGQEGPKGALGIVGPTQWPKAHAVPVDLAGTGEPVDYEVFEGFAVAYVPVIIADTAPAGSLQLVVTGGYQACDDTSCARPITFNEIITLNVVAVGADIPNANTDAKIFGGFDNAVFPAMLAGSAIASQDTDFTFFGLDFSVGSTGAVNTIIILALAVLGGFLLNLTPCVLPVIPIKIMSLSSAAAGHPRRAMLLGGVMSLGVVAFFMAIGLAIATLSSFRAINQLFQHPEFSLGVGVFILAMGVGMVGLFSIKLPNAVYALDPNRESVVGSFFFGVLTAILSTPCTAPFMGSAAAWAAKQPAALTLVTFAAIGLGMALPYLVLSAFPRLVRSVPRTGPASSLIKQVMGLFLVAVSIFFIGTGLDGLLREPIDPSLNGYWWAIAAVTAFASFWLIYRTFKITRKPIPRGVITILGLAAAVSIFSLARSITDKGPINWTYYTPARFDEAIARGDVVVLDFTAAWCANCIALEKGVLNRDAVASVLNGRGVTAMKVDLTGNNVAGADKLNSLNWTGIPLLAIYGPELDEPLKYDTYTPDVVLKAIQRAGKSVETMSGERSMVDWLPHGPVHFERAKAEGDVVVVNLPVFYDPNNGVLEDHTFQNAEVAKALNAKGVAPIRVAFGESVPAPVLDWFDGLNVGAMPTVLIYGPNLPKRIVLDVFTPETVLAAIDQARGG